MQTEDLVRHRTLIDQAHECRRRAGEAIGPGHPLTAQALRAYGRSGWAGPVVTRETDNGDPA